MNVFGSLREMLAQNQKDLATAMERHDALVAEMADLDKMIAAKKEGIASLEMLLPHEAALTSFGLTVEPEAKIEEKKPEPEIELPKPAPIPEPTPAARVLPPVQPAWAKANTIGEAAATLIKTQKTPLTMPEIYQMLRQGAPGLFADIDTQIAKNRISSTFTRMANNGQLVKREKGGYTSYACT